jgi:hypothetical protein
MILIILSGVRLSPLGTAGNTGLLYQPQCHFVHHKSHMTRHGLEPGPPQWEAATNRLSCLQPVAQLSHDRDCFPRATFRQDRQDNEYGSGTSIWPLSTECAVDLVESVLLPRKPRNQVKKHGLRLNNVQYDSKGKVVPMLD